MSYREIFNLYAEALEEGDWVAAEYYLSMLRGYEEEEYYEYAA